MSNRSAAHSRWSLWTGARPALYSGSARDLVSHASELPELGVWQSGSSPTLSWQSPLPVTLAFLFSVRPPASSRSEPWRPPPSPAGPCAPPVPYRVHSEAYLLDLADS